MTDLTWNPLLRDQLTWHWTYQLRDRLNGLTDGEYLCEPGPGCWSVRPRGTSAAPVQAGSGALTIDFAMPEPDPPPFTTIAWRRGHVIVGVLAVRNAVHFGRAPTDYQSFKYAATAAVALAQLDAKYATWLAGLEPDLVLGQIVQRQVTQSRFLQAADPVFGPRSLPVPQLQIGQLAAHGTGGEQGDPPTVGVGEP